MASIAGCTALVWSKTEHDANSWQNAVAFAVAIGLGMFCSMMMAGISGAAAPLLFKRCGFDPSAMAGPLETAFQDIVGGTLLLAVSAWILATFGDEGEECDIGGCLEKDCSAQILLSAYKECVQACVAKISEC